MYLTRETCKQVQACGNALFLCLLLGNNYKIILFFSVLQSRKYITFYYRFLM